MNIKSLLKSIFLIENDNSHKIITIFGIRIKFKVYKIVDPRTYLSNEVFAANCIKQMHSKTFPKYKNCHTGHDIVITATGPTMNYYTPIKNAIHIGINRAYKNENIKLDYLFVTDYNETNKENIEEIVNYPANIFLGTYYTINYFARRHSIPLMYKELPHINCYAIDYPRNLMYPDLEFCGLMDYGSTAFNAAHFATYTHPKRIYLVGCDCSQTGHFDNSPPFNDLNIDAIYNGWIRFKEYCEWYYPDIEIISINPVGLKGMFKDTYTQSYIDEHFELLEEGVKIFENNEIPEPEVVVNV